MPPSFDVIGLRAPRGLTAAKNVESHPKSAAKTAAQPDGFLYSVSRKAKTPSDQEALPKQIVCII